MRNENFWGNNPNSELWKQTKRFVEENDKTCGLSDTEQDEYAKELLGFIELNKKTIACEYNLEGWREDIYQWVCRYFKSFGRELYKVLPIGKLDRIAIGWREDIDANEACAEDIKNLLADRLREEPWFADYQKYNQEQKNLYLVYLDDWYKTHVEGAPVCISEFLNNEMKDEELSTYYKQLLEDKKSGEAQEKRQADLIDAIVNRAALLGFLQMERCVAVEVMKLATEHYDLDLEAMWHGSDFDFLHDFVYIPMHFNPRTGFDNRFLPRFSKRSLE